MKSIEHEVQSLDKCPVCGCEHDGYDSLDFDRDKVYLRFNCPDCGMYHVETYKYDNTWYEEFHDEKEPGGIFDGKYVYFIRRRDPGTEAIAIGNCNADSHWEALGKFEEGMGMSEPMVHGRTYEIYRDLGDRRNRKVKTLLKFEY